MPIVLLLTGLLALGTSCTSIPREWPTPWGKNAEDTPEARIASSEFHDPEPGASGDLKIPSFWKPFTRVRWQISCTLSQWRADLMISNDCCEAYEIMANINYTESGLFTYFLHFKNKFINSSCFRGKFPSVTDGHGTGDIRRVALPLTASINKKDLWMELFWMSISKIVLIMVIMRLDRSPWKFAIVTAIMKSWCAGGSSYYWKVCLMHRSWEQQCGEQKSTKQNNGTNPSLLQDATKMASASASFSISHSPGRRGLFNPSASSSILPLTALPSTRITTSWARELISLACLMAAISSISLVNRARWRAERRYKSVTAPPSEANTCWVYSSGRTGKSGEFLGRVWNRAPGRTFMRVSMAAGRAAGWSILGASYICLASSRDGGGTDHIKSASSALGIKSWTEGVPYREVPGWYAARRKDEGTVHPDK